MPLVAGLLSFLRFGTILGLSLSFMTWTVLLCRLSLSLGFSEVPSRLEGRFLSLSMS